MRIWLGVGAVLLAMRVPLALADRDPNSGAPLPPPKHASTPSPITDHFYIKAAYFAPKLHTSLQVDPSNAPAGVVGTPVSGENTLGLPERLHEGRVRVTTADTPDSRLFKEEKAPIRTRSGERLSRETVDR